jgi:hypothetical protein
MPVFRNNLFQEDGGDDGSSETLVTICRKIRREIAYQFLKVASMKIRAFWDVAPCSLVGVIALMMDVVSTSETSVYSTQITRHYIPEGSNLQEYMMSLPRKPQSELTI